jgi:hypothetical protein
MLRGGFKIRSKSVEIKALCQRSPGLGSWDRTFMPLIVSFSGRPVIFRISGSKIREAVPVSGQLNNHSHLQQGAALLHLSKNIIKNKKRRLNLISARLLRRGLMRTASAAHLI